jgi:hypothetical protein
MRDTFYLSKDQIEEEFIDRFNAADNIVKSSVSSGELYKLVASLPSSKEALKNFVKKNPISFDRKLKNKYMMLFEKEDKPDSLLSRLLIMRSKLEAEMNKMDLGVSAIHEPIKRIKDLYEIEIKEENFKRWESISQSNFRSRVSIESYMDPCESVVADVVYVDDQEYLNSWLLFTNRLKVYRVEYPGYRKTKILKSKGIYQISDFKYITSKKMMMPSHPYRLQNNERGNKCLALEPKQVLYSSFNSTILNPETKFRKTISPINFYSSKDYIIVDIKSHDGKSRPYSFMINFLSFEINVYNLKTCSLIKTCYGENITTGISFFDGSLVVMTADSKSKQVIKFNMNKHSI